ncbi:MAG TPA: DUF1622 domain-containing protein [Chloroflexota bacterium]|nr:DUF1622 domain-containing protein [Chloroflexota bacterium]
MPLADWLGIRAWIVVIQLGGALAITGYAAKALVTLVRARSVEEARLVMADGVIVGLTVLVVATLLKTIVLQSWTDIGLFAVTLGLRTLLKRLFAWEEAQLRRRAARRVAGA